MERPRLHTPDYDDGLSAHFCVFCALLTGEVIKGNFKSVGRLFAITAPEHGIVRFSETVLFLRGYHTMGFVFAYALLRGREVRGVVFLNSPPITPCRPYKRPYMKPLYRRPWCRTYLYWTLAPLRR